VLATGNHYVLDVLAGLATLALAMLIVAIVARKTRPLPVAHVTMLLRSLRPGRLDRSPQIARER
jgi:membrane-associated phospholipid phosphatase